MSTSADAAFDRYARLAQEALGTPVALVALTTSIGSTGSTASTASTASGELVLAGAVGLPEPFQSERRAPLARSLAQLVTEGGVPLIVPDLSQLDDLPAGDPDGEPVFRQLGFVAYVGIPIELGERTVGVLGAVDDRPRLWSAGEVRFLSDLAAACAAELRSRAAQQEARTAAALAENAQAQAARAERHTRLLLALSEALSATTTIEDVASTVAELAAAHLHARSAKVMIHDAASGSTPGVVPRSILREGDTAEVSLDTRLRLPLNTAAGSLALALDRTLAPDERSVVAALARYAAAAIDRALLLQERRDVATALQLAMLPELAPAGDVLVRGRYVPAARVNRVGGDWYDAFTRPDGTIKLAIGDVAGHDITAAAQMGQVRNFLRALSFDRGQTPAAILTRLDALLSGLRLPIVSTAFMAYLEPGGPDHPGTTRMTWSSAGHPPPLLLPAGGESTVLDGEPGLLLGIDPGSPRADHTVLLTPGTTVLLYSDGLIDRPGRPPSEGIQLLAQSLDRHADLDLDPLLDQIVTEFIHETSTDDCVILAARLP